MRGDWQVVSQKPGFGGGSGREQGCGKVGDGVRRERSFRGRKLVTRHKLDVLGRWGFTIAGHRERGSMRQDILKDAGQGGIALEAGLPCKQCRAMSGASGRRLLRRVCPDFSFCVWTKRVLTSTPRTGVYVVCACSGRRIGCAGCSRTQVVVCADDI